MDYCLINGFLCHLIEDVVMVSGDTAYIEELVPKEHADGTWELVSNSRVVQLDPAELKGRPLKVLLYIIKATNKKLTVEARELFKDMLILKSTLKKGTVWPESTVQRFFGKHLRTLVALELLRKQGDGYGFFFI